MRGTKRGDRMAQVMRMKARARRVMSYWGTTIDQTLDLRRVGIGESTHCRPCSCWMCRSDDNRIPRARERAFHDPDMPA